MLFARGANAVQVQRWLGHHSAAFTLSRYVHLLRGDLGDPLSLADELPHPGGNAVATHDTGLHGDYRHSEPPNGHHDPGGRDATDVGGYPVTAS
jgi:hypothetical protein